MIFLAVMAVLAVAVVASGRDLSGLRRLGWRHLWVAPIALAMQVVGLEVVEDGAVWVVHVLHLGSYALAAAWIVANRDVPGVLLAGIGGGANLLAIGTNGGVMPAHPAAVELAGLPAADGFVNSAAATDAPLWWLGDVFATPASWPLANVFSVGDVVLMVGFVVLLWAASAPRPATWSIPLRRAVSPA